MEYNKSVKDGLRDQIDIIIRANNILFEYFTLVRCDINVFFFCNKMITHIFDIP